MGKKIRQSERYPEKHDVPRELVLARRAERKANHKRKVVIRKEKCKVTGQKLDYNPKIGIWDFKFRLDKKVREFQDSKCKFNIGHNQTFDTFRIRVREPTREYLDWMWTQMRSRRVSAELAFRIFPNVKEQTEAAAVYFALKPLVDLQQTSVLVVADGSTPRAGGLVACFAKRVISIDPQMRACFVDKSCGFLPENLTCTAKTVEQFVEQDLVPDEKETFVFADTPSVAVVAMHAHVNFNSYLDQLLQKIHPQSHIVVMAVPCCIPLFVPPEVLLQHHLELHSEQDVWAIHSPHRKVSLWVRKKKIRTH